MVLEGLCDDRVGMPRVPRVVVLWHRRGSEPELPTGDSLFSGMTAIQRQACRYAHVRFAVHNLARRAARVLCLLAGLPQDEAETTRRRALKARAAR
mmetsp:Transcript_53541/g.142309  ORF Transcript_53541/g.142309 Transcript_53541/m.142309 type:complete len:96 (+) Transcript_53541:171-458(+)